MLNLLADLKNNEIRMSVSSLKHHSLMGGAIKRNPCVYRLNNSYTNNYFHCILANVWTHYSVYSLELRVKGV